MLLAGSALCATDFLNAELDLRRPNRQILAMFKLKVRSFNITMALKKKRKKKTETEAEVRGIKLRNLTARQNQPHQRQFRDAPVCVRAITV